ncbi:aspartate kinase [Vibrio ichthyoenteri ATCC 700023]|uniref:Aspartokinase n=1 Tax=Vibrio ichthyoenteri ATCC 700023 TaxID=870968 RepID=F9S447_9VIBR|nr:aspartate kinase [Vibrio ichthyoenteri]EGU37263.1 aspartate kinase [Vibrio ichthyoenteri ATCC 700023]
MKKPLIVQKFGGTSVGSIERIHAVAEHIINAKKQGNHLVVVVSAMSGETNRLMDLAKQVDAIPTARELDVLLSAGEQVSMALLAMTLNKLGYAACSLTGSQAGITTDTRHNDATISRIDTTLITNLLAQDNIVIVAGFQGMNELGDITTLGRGGSDTTAVTLAGALNAHECQIFTDVDGIYSCDPRVVTAAQRLAEIDFPSMERMAYHGAKVLHLPSVQYAWRHQVPLRVLSSFELNSGTLVKGEACQSAITGLAIQRDMCLIHIESSNFLNVEKQCQLLGVMISSVIEHPEWLGVVIKQDDYTKLELAFQQKISNSEAIGLLTVVGLQAEQSAEHSCQLLAAQSIKTIHVASDGLSITLAISLESIDKAANILHHAHIASNEAHVCLQKHASLNE